MKVAMGNELCELEPEEERELIELVLLRAGAVATESVKSGRGGLQSLQGEYPERTASRSDIGILLLR